MQADKQDDYLETFRREMEANPPREIATPQPVGMPSQVILVQEPPRSAAQLTARAELYGNAAWQAGQKLIRHRILKTVLPNVLLEPKDQDTIDLVAEPPNTRLPYPVAGPPVKKQPPSAKPPPGARWERNMLGEPVTGHCAECPGLHGMGWQPIGTFPDIGDRECGGYCLCWFEYSNSVERPDDEYVIDPKTGLRVLKEKVTPEPIVVAPIKANPTNEEIDAEFKKWKEGKPSAIAIKDAVKPPAWSTEQEEADAVLPPGYEWSS